MTLVLVLLAGPSAAQRTGRLTGRVVGPNGGGVSGVTVALAGVDVRAVITDATGRFALDGVPPGTHTVEFSLLGFAAEEAGVEINAGGETTIRKEVDWDYVLAESLTVISVSRRPERIVEAPAAVSSITPQRIAREAPSGQLAKILESSTGAEVTQSGLFDFKINVRGVNGSVNRRVAVLIDGRNPSFPMTGAQEWSAVSFPVDDLAGAELIRGPSSALYGANAFNGILNLTTRSATHQQGGFVRLSVGDLNTTRLELSAATPIGGGWHTKVVGGYHDSEDFAVSRDRTVEYSQPCPPGGPTVDCLALEAIPLPLDRVKLAFGGLRFDRDMPNGRSVTIEGGTASIEGTVFTTSLGRFQLRDVKRPWARFNLNSPHWNLLGTYSGRDAEAATLVSGLPSFANGSRSGLEWQTSHELGGGRARVVGGVFLGRDEIDSTDPNGMETLLTEPKSADLKAVFGQLDYHVSDRAKLVLAGRWDDSSLHDSQLSPKASLVYSMTPTQVLRFSYNQGFLAPNFPELFLSFPLGVSLDLSGFEAICAPTGVSCGFDRPVPILLVGNDNLTVEKIRSFEIGYHGILGRKAFLSADVYWSRMEDFVQVLIPQVGTEAGRANPDFGPYMAPAALPPAVAGLLEGIIAGIPDLAALSNFPDGSPVFIGASNVNFGEVETMGFELSLDYALGPRWNLDFNYSWLDFDAKAKLVANPLAANAPDNKANLGVTYTNDRFTGSAYFRWFDSFRWEEGLVQGPVPSYGVLNLVGQYDLSDAWQVGINVSNALDDEHYEFFLGDLMGLRATAHVAYRWR